MGVFFLRPAMLPCVLPSATGRERGMMMMMMIIIMMDDVEWRVEEAGGDRR